MNERLISFETAVLAKEKGFDITVTQGYDSLDMDYQRFSLPKGVKLGICTNDSPTSFTAPTQSLLQSWLRKIHNIDVQPICNYHYILGRQYLLGIIFVNKDNKVDTIIIKETNKSLDTINRHYSSYEEALEEGLFQALNLIESK